MTDVLAPARPSRRFRRFFGGYTRRLMRKRFAAVRIVPESHDLLASLAAEHRPAVLAMNHASWWDPLVGLALCEKYLPGRPGAAPMEMEQWRTFGFMRRLGIFGVEPDHPDAMDVMIDHVSALFDRDPSTVFVITPQGTFTDVRVPARLRPGLSALGARRPDARIVTVACEYGFWNDQRPELFIRAESVVRPQSNSTPAWHRTITRAMRDNQEALARLVIDRDEADFAMLFERSGARVNPLYDLIARLRGRSTEVRSREQVQ